jgi:uncharacterized lipoprotein NlpE involved in copper resistance
MKKFILLTVVVSAFTLMGCKKKKADDTGAGSAAPTTGDMTGSAAGSAMAGSATTPTTGSDTGSAAGSAMAGSAAAGSDTGSAAAGSAEGSAMAGSAAGSAEKK